MNEHRTTPELTDDQPGDAIAGATPVRALRTPAKG